MFDTRSMTPNHPKTSPSSFASDVLKLVGGTTFAQALAILAVPVLTRIYAPEAFGVAALSTAITGIVAVISGLRYELAIMLPEKDEDAANVLGLSLLIVAGMSALMGLVVWLGQEWLVRLLNAPGLAPYLWLAQIAVFLSGTFLALNGWNSRTKRFGRLSIARGQTGGGAPRSKLRGMLRAAALVVLVCRTAPKHVAL